MAKRFHGLGQTVVDHTGQPVIDLDGKEATVQSILVGILSRSRSRDPIRAIATAFKIRDTQATESVVLDDSDIEAIREAMTEAGLSNIVYYRLDEILKVGEVVV